MQTIRFSFLILILTSGLGSFAKAAPALPQCMDHGHLLPVDNQQVIQWKNSTDNQFQSRGHVSGKVSHVFSDATGHDHFEVQIGSDASDVIEIIYNHEFGALPNLSIGMDVEACGDYITSNATSGGHQASPCGALLHWVHFSDSDSHDSGYVAVNGQLYGTDVQNYDQHHNGHHGN